MESFEIENEGRARLEVEVKQSSWALISTHLVYSAKNVGVYRFRRKPSFPFSLTKASVLTHGQFVNCIVMHYDACASRPCLLAIATAHATTGSEFVVLKTEAAI